MKGECPTGSAFVEGWDPYLSPEQQHEIWKQRYLEEVVWNNARDRAAVSQAERLMRKWGKAAESWKARQREAGYQDELREKEELNRRAYEERRKREEKARREEEDRAAEELHRWREERRAIEGARRRAAERDARESCPAKPRNEKPENTSSETRRGKCIEWDQACILRNWRPDDWAVVGVSAEWQLCNWCMMGLTSHPWVSTRAQCTACTGCLLSPAMANAANYLMRSGCCIKWERE